MNVTPGSALLCRSACRRAPRQQERDTCSFLFYLLSALVQKDPSDLFYAFYPLTRNGKKSFLPWRGESPKKHAPEGRPGNNKKSNKHEYSSWLYINDYSVEPGLSGEVMVEIEFPGKEKSQKNNIYHIATNRSVGYTRIKERRFAPNIVLEGVVTIRRV